MTNAIKLIKYKSTSNKESGFDSNFNLNDLLFDKNSKTHSNTLNSNIYEDTSLLDLSVFESKSTASGSVLSSAIQQPTSAAVYSTVQPKMPNTIPMGDLNQLVILIIPLNLTKNIMKYFAF